jgi:hypothetical protein
MGGQAPPVLTFRKTDMPNQLMRVLLLPQDGDVEARQIVIDMQVDASGKATGPFPAFGRIGDFKRPETLQPFALMFDGRMDLGAYAPDHARQAILEIRNATLVPGAEIARVASGRETYVVSTLTDLLG